jgi:hypothetical protein
MEQNKHINTQKKKLQKMTQPKTKDINLSITKKSPKDSSTRGHIGRRRQ